MTRTTVATVVVLQVIGGGRMGEALIGGLLKREAFASTGCAGSSPTRSGAIQLSAAFPGVDVADEPTTADGPSRVLSIASGVTVAAIAPGTQATDEDMAWADELLSAVGTVVHAKEPLLDAATGLSGSGPADVFLVAEALIEAGVLAGLPRDVSRALSVQTLLGAATLMAEGPDGPESLRAAVASPGRTTAAGLQVLEQRGLRAAFLDAVAAATARSRELGG